MAITEFPINTTTFEELEPITDAQSTDSDGVMLYDDSVGVMKRMTKGELFKGKVIPIDDITGFLGIDYLQVSDRQQYHMNSFAPGGESGGGSLMWSATLPKILHDGVRYFSPTVPMPADFDNEQDVQDYKEGVGEEFPADLGIFVLTSFSIQSSEFPAVDNAIVLFDGVSGNRVKNGPVPTEIGLSLIESPIVEEVSYHRLNTGGTVTARNTVDHKTDLQLNNVDNTSDADKPISDAVQVALDDKADAIEVDDAIALKADLESPAFTGNPTAPTPAADDDSESIATTEYVQGELSDRVQSVATIADLRSLADVVVGQEFSVREYASGTGFGGGQFVARSGAEADDDVVVFETVNGVRVWRKDYATLTPEMGGGVPGGDVQESVDRIIACGKSKSFRFGDGVYEFANIDLPDFSTVRINANTTLRKNANGYIFDLGRHSKIEGKGTFDGNYTGAGVTGSSIVITKGKNATNYAMQGHQRVIDARFINSDSWHVLYTYDGAGSGAGWMSELRGCNFTQKPANVSTSVKWPSEPVNGGNRHIVGGYSACPVVNVGHADNGVIAFVEIGAVGADATGENGIIFPANTTISVAGVPTPVTSAKIRVVGCRFSGGEDITVKVRGGNHTFVGNEVNCNIEFTSNSVNCVGGAGNDFSQGFRFVDNSLTSSRITLDTPVFFTPTVKAGLTLGNGTLQGEYMREGAYVKFRIELDVGSTTAITGTVVFNLPVATREGTRTFTGTAWGQGHAGIAYVSTGTNNDVRVYNSSTVGTWNATTPKAYAAGDKWIIEATYRIF